MSNEAKEVCSTPGCGKQLRSNNRTGKCTPCRLGRGQARPDNGVAWGGERGGREDVRKKFKIVAGALGKDPDAILDEFCAAWLDNLRARLPADDESDKLTGISDEVA